jgi:hypothetical protein
MVFKDSLKDELSCLCRASPTLTRQSSIYPMQPDHSVEVRPLYSTASVLQRKGAPERYDFE